MKLSELKVGQKGRITAGPDDLGAVWNGTEVVICPDGKGHIYKAGSEPREGIFTYRPEQFEVELLPTILKLSELKPGQKGKIVNGQMPSWVGAVIEILPDGSNRRVTSSVTFTSYPDEWTVELLADEPIPVSPLKTPAPEILPKPQRIKMADMKQGQIGKVVGDERSVVLCARIDGSDALLPICLQSGNRYADNPAASSYEVELLGADMVVVLSDLSAKVEISADVKPRALLAGFVALPVRTPPQQRTEKLQEAVVPATPITVGAPIGPSWFCPRLDEIDERVAALQTDIRNLFSLASETRARTADKQERIPDLLIRLQELERLTHRFQNMEAVAKDAAKQPGRSWFSLLARWLSRRAESTR